MRGPVDTALSGLKDAVKNQNISDIDRYTSDLNNAMQTAYQAMAGQAGPQGPQGPQPGPQDGPQAPDEQ